MHAEFITISNPPIALHDRIRLQLPSGEVTLIVKDAIDLYPNEVRRFLKYSEEILDNEAVKRLNWIMDAGIHDIIPGDDLRPIVTPPAESHEICSHSYAAISPLRLL